MEVEKEFKKNEEKDQLKKEEEKYKTIIDDLFMKINVLSDLLNTEEIQQLTNYSANLNSSKKKLNGSRSLTLNLKENEVININEVKTLKNSIYKNGKMSKSK